MFEPSLFEPGVVFCINYIGKLSGPTHEFEPSLVFETGEFERPKFDCINNGIHALLKHGFVTLTMSCPGHRINRRSIVLEILEKTAGVRKFLAPGGGILSIILCPRDLHMSSQ